MNATVNEVELTRPLEGVRVVEFGVWHAGPGSCAILADLGAQVIKVESLEGDPERQQRNLGTVDFGAISFRGDDKEDWSLLFEITNRSKRGICLDISTAAGKEILNRLVKAADIFMTNLRKSTKYKLGIDYETLVKVNPKLIHMNVSGYGEEGPMSNVGAFDPLGQAISGMVFMTGPDQPIVVQPLFLDQLTAITASHAMITALYVRERTGRGQSLYVSLYGSAIWLMHANIMGSSIMNKTLQVAWDRTKQPALRNSYKCKDGKWLMTTNHPEDKYWPRFCEVMGMKHLERDARYATTEAREKCPTELVALFDEVIKTKTRDEWVQLFLAHGLLYVPIQDAFQVVRDPQALANDYIVQIDHPTLGPVSVPGYPVKFGINRITSAGPAPDRGEHTQAILHEIGYDTTEIAAMKQTKIIN